MLREYGEFYPYGGYVKPDGEIVHVGAKSGHTDHPKSQELIDLLQGSFREMARAKQCKATAIICDVKVKLPDSDRKSDAIQACLDHESGYSVKVFFPYELIAGEIVYGDTFAYAGERQIFIDD